MKVPTPFENRSPSNTAVELSRSSSLRVELVKLGKLFSIRPDTDVAIHSLDAQNWLQTDRVILRKSHNCHRLRLKAWFIPATRGDNPTFSALRGSHKNYNEANKRTTYMKQFMRKAEFCRKIVNRQTPVPPDRSMLIKWIQMTIARDCRSVDVFAITWKRTHRVRWNKSSL